MTHIEWTDRTWNPVTGCDRTSPGCDNCYALTMAKRLKAMGQPRYQNDGDPRTSGPGFGLTVHPEVLTTPRRWGRPSMVFVNSMSDLFHRDVPTGFIQKVWDEMAASPQHTFQVLTKRAARMQELIRGAADGLLWTTREGVVLPNVWLGVSVESNRYTFRVDHLRDTAAAVRFVSCEPLLGPLPSLDLTDIDWVIIGAESGPGARGMDDDWAREIVAKARAAGTAVFVKQLTASPGKVVKDIDRFRAGLQIREWPIR